MYCTHQQIFECSMYMENKHVYVCTVYVTAITPTQRTSFVKFSITRKFAFSQRRARAALDDPQQILKRCHVEKDSSPSLRSPNYNPFSRNDMLIDWKVF